MQTCIRPSWCHCHSLSPASVKSWLVLHFWYRLTWVVPDKGPLNARVCVLQLLLGHLQSLHRYSSFQHVVHVFSVWVHGRVYWTRWTSWDAILAAHLCGLKEPYIIYESRFPREEVFLWAYAWEQIQSEFRSGCSCKGWCAAVMRIFPRLLWILVILLWLSSYAHLYISTQRRGTFWEDGENRNAVA